MRRLRESEQRFRTMIERASDAIFAIDHDTGEVLDATERMEKTVW